eukprot:1161047-Pelagomonas_calceolata.AAC.19
MHAGMLPVAPRRTPLLANSKDQSLVFHVYAWRAADGTKEDPVLAKFEEEISVYKSVSAEVSALPSSITINFVKINAKPLRTALTTWASNVYSVLFILALACPHPCQAAVAGTAVP